MLRVKEQTGLPRPPDAPDPWELVEFEIQHRTSPKDKTVSILNIGDFTLRRVTHYSYGIVMDRAMLDYNSHPIDGIMYSYITNSGERTGFAVTRDAVDGSDQRYLRAVAHELGHTFNLHHGDGDGSQRNAHDAVDIMCGGSTPKYYLTFAPASQAHLADHPRESCARPGPFSFNSVAVDHPVSGNRICLGHDNTERTCDD